MRSRGLGVIILTGVLAIALAAALLFLPKAYVVAREIRGETRLTRFFTEAPDTSFELVDLSKVHIDRVLEIMGVPPEFRPVFALHGQQSGSVYVVLSDPARTRHMIFYTGARGIEVRELEFTELSREQLEKEGPAYEVEVNGTKARIEGVLKCEITKRASQYESLQVGRIDFDCYYTTRLGGVSLATTHAKGVFYYIPGQMVTGYTDLSYVQVHQPYVQICWFRPDVSGVGQQVAALKAEGKFQICFAITSTQWTQFARFVLDAQSESYWCEGSHSAWAAPSCLC